MHDSNPVSKVQAMIDELKKFHGLAHDDELERMLFGLGGKMEGDIVQLEDGTIVEVATLGFGDVPARGRILFGESKGDVITIRIHGATIPDPQDIVKARVKDNTE